MNCKLVLSQRSQLFHSLLFFFNHAKLRSTIQCLGMSLNVRSLLKIQSTFGIPAKKRKPTEQGLGGQSRMERLTRKKEPVPCGSLGKEKGGWRRRLPDPAIKQTAAPNEVDALVWPGWHRAWLGRFHVITFVAYEYDAQVGLGAEICQEITSERAAARVHQGSVSGTVGQGHRRLSDCSLLHGHHTLVGVMRSHGIRRYCGRANAISVFGCAMSPRLQTCGGRLVVARADSKAAFEGAAQVALVGKARVQRRIGNGLSGTQIRACQVQALQQAMGLGWYAMLQLELPGVVLSAEAIGRSGLAHAGSGLYLQLFSAGCSGAWHCALGPVLCQHGQYILPAVQSSCQPCLAQLCTQALLCMACCRQVGIDAQQLLRLGQRVVDRARGDEQGLACLCAEQRVAHRNAPAALQHDDELIFRVEMRWQRNLSALNLAGLHRTLCGRWPIAPCGLPCCELLCCRHGQP